MYVYHFSLVILLGVLDSYHPKGVNKLTWDIFPFILLLLLKHAITYDIPKLRI